MTLFWVLTVPRALSRIHHITKFTLKRAAEQSRSKTDTAKRHQKIDNRGRLDLPLYFQTPVIT
ncbi:hypothetical protein C2131_00005 [Escherichia coli]|nr:hypothetical protein C2131_00005 [Escherichia coli]